MTEKIGLIDFILKCGAVTMGSYVSWEVQEVLNTLTNYEKLIQEHEVIQANLKIIVSSADHLLTLSTLQDRPIDFTYHQVSFLSDRRVNLKRAILSLKEGLVDHHLREEEALRDMVGERLIQSIKQEHSRIMEKLSEIDWILLNISPVGILFNISFLKQKIDEMCQILFASCVRENSILELLIKIPRN